jgi:hypothetical protein
MEHQPVDLTAVAADDALVSRISVGVTAGQDITELEQLLVAWRNACLATSVSP